MDLIAPPARFLDLRRTGLQPRDENARADLFFPQLVARSGMRLWRPGDGIAPGRRLLLGVVTWSLYDLGLLDVLCQLREGGRHADLAVDVFDLDRERDFERFVPGLDPVVQPPVAGFWEAGLLHAGASGYRARELVCARLRIRLEWDRSEWKYRLLT
jgi:hypothetical protein